MSQYEFAEISSPDKLREVVNDWMTKEFVGENSEVQIEKNIVLLEGPMGVGKTEFTKQLVSILSHQIQKPKDADAADSVKDRTGTESSGSKPSEDGIVEACSPTFSIQNNYIVESGISKKQVSHLDLYRLEDEEDLESTGFWDLFLNQKQMVVIEWADRLDIKTLPRDWQIWRVQLNFKAETGANEVSEVSAGEYSKILSRQLTITRGS